jgi:hypothetical protein
MKCDAMDEDLVGYVLDALDPDARQEVETRLEEQPQARARLERLRRVLEPLAADAEAGEPPAGLALSALARIAEYRCRRLPDAPPPSAFQRVTPPSRRMPRRADLLVAAALLILISGLALPGIRRLWHVYNHRATCADNLRVLWTGLQAYGNSHEGMLPQVEERGPRSVAGIFVPVLHEAGVLRSDARLVCPGDDTQPLPTPHRLGTLEELYRSRPEAFLRAAHDLAGSYAYSMGYKEGDVLQGLRCDSGDLLPVMADRLPCAAPGNSPNHGGAGQNVLYLGGKVRWCANRSAGIDGDDIYLNRRNEVHAGLAREDTVLGCSDSSP